eukprot:1463378-Rhodomonas_salina.2
MHRRTRIALLTRTALGLVIGISLDSRPITPVLVRAPLQTATGKLATAPLGSEEAAKPPHAKPGSGTAAMGARNLGREPQLEYLVTFDFYSNRTNKSFAHSCLALVASAANPCMLLFPICI